MTSGSSALPTRAISLSYIIARGGRGRVHRGHRNAGAKRGRRPGAGRDPGGVRGTGGRPPRGACHKRDQWFESGSLQRGVSLCSESRGYRRKGPRFRGALGMDGDERRDETRASRALCRFFSNGHWCSPTSGSLDIHRVSQAGRQPRRASRCEWAIQLASRLCCSVQLRGRSSSVRRVAVSSTGCRPCRIASTSCGLRKARSIRRRM